MQDQILQALRSNAADEAVQLARQWLAGAPDEAQAYRWLAASLRQQGETDAALDNISRAIALDPENAELHLERAGLLLGVRQVGEAEAALARSTGLDPNQFQAYVAQAQLALMRGELDEAQRLSRHAARLDPEHPRLAAVQAQLALRQGDPDRALALASAASVHIQDDPQLLSVLGFGYQAKRHWAFAEQAFRKVLELQPDAHGVRPLLARLAATQGRPDEAVDLLAALLDDPATATPALHRLAGLYALQAGQREQARGHLRHALAGGPERAVLQGLMALWRDSGDLDEARSTLEAVLATHRDSGGLWAARLSLEAPGTAEGERVLERWLDAMPEHGAALEAAMFARGHAGDLEGMGHAVDRLLRAHPDHPFAERYRLEMLFQRDPDAALARARAMVEPGIDGTGHQGPQAWLGRLFDRADHYREALQAWLAFHGRRRTECSPLPRPAGAGAGEWPPLPDAAPGSSRPFLVWGLPGSCVERVVETLAGAGVPVLHDRFGTQPPADALHSPETAQALHAGTLDPAGLVAQWRSQLPARGVADGNAVDWLPHWDNALLLALRPHLPEGVLLIAVRDPRDMLLDWLAFGSPAPLALETPEAAADWLAQGLEQLADLREQDLYPYVLLRLDTLLDSPPALAETLGQALGLGNLPPAAGAPRLPPGRWRAYADLLAAPFARLAPVAARLGYPEA